MNRNNKTAVSIVILIVIGFTIYFFYPRGQATAKLDYFAKCLASKNVTMYGAYWCAHCQNQKAAFGSSFKYVPYVECTQETQKCLAQKINGYPTWVLDDGRRFEGEQSLTDLSIQSGCSLSASSSTQ